MPKGLRAEDAVKDAQPPPDWLQNTSCAGFHLLTLRIVSHDGDVTSSVVGNEDESCRSKENEPWVSSRTQHDSFDVKGTAGVAASPRHAAGETEQVQQEHQQRLVSFDWGRYVEASLGTHPRLQQQASELQLVRRESWAATDGESSPQLPAGLDRHKAAAAGGPCSQCDVQR